MPSDSEINNGSSGSHMSDMTKMVIVSPCNKSCSARLPEELDKFPAHAKSARNDRILWQPRLRMSTGILFLSQDIPGTVSDAALGTMHCDGADASGPQGTRSLGAQTALKRDKTDNGDKR